MRSLFAATLIGAVTVSALSTFQKEDQFMEWIARYGRAYETRAEYTARYAIWNEVNEFITEVNTPGSGWTHTAGHNKFSDWTPEEFRNMMNKVGEGHELPPVEPSHDANVAGKIVDWTTGSCVNPVVDQGSCGSCWAFAGTAAVESAYCIGGGPLYKLSEQQLVSCSTTLNSGCNGGLAFNAWTYLETHGQMLESAYPYTATDGTCKYVASEGKVMTVPDNAYTQVDGQSASASINMAAGVDIEPTEVSIHASSIVFQSYQSGVITSGCGTSTNHAVVIVGYNSDATTPYWKVRNSWGSGWGDKGYVNIAWGPYPGVCGINQRVGYPHTQTWTG